MGSTRLVLLATAVLTTVPDRVETTGAGEATAPSRTPLQPVGRGDTPLLCRKQTVGWVPIYQHSWSALPMSSPDPIACSDWLHVSLLLKVTPEAQTLCPVRRPFRLDFLGSQATTSIFHAPF